ncbi:MAG: hypothetical protein ABSE16_13185 [Verrucomicrobiota bacterium]|jgi:hypothetical protein
MELKLVCGCGQKYKFNVEPLGGRMPFAVKCPVCGADGTSAANAILDEKSVTQPILLSTAGAAAIGAPVSPGLSIKRPTPAPAPLPPPRKPFAAPKAGLAGSFGLATGILGGLLGAAVGGVLTYGFFAVTGFRFPLMGAAIGILCGLGAKLLAGRTHAAMSALAAAFAFAANGATLFLIFGEFPPVYVLSLIIGAGFAYRMAS